MREVVVRLPAHTLDAALDRLLPLAPDGVRDTPVGEDEIELRLRGDQLPSTAAILRALAPIRVDISERAVSDDWRARRLSDYTPDAIAGRLVVRPPWAPAAPDGMLEIVLEEGSAFGAGTHPTTRTCLELLLDLSPAGSFADLGCGSGVLAILAVRRGWSPVTAVDVHPASVDAAQRNATANGAEIETAARDLSREPAPPARGFAANVPPPIHRAIVAGWDGAPAPAVGLISGFGPEHAKVVLDAYAASGLQLVGRHDVHGWVVAELARS